MLRIVEFPTSTSGMIPGDLHGRTFADLNHWFRRQKSTLRKACVDFYGVDLMEQKKLQLLQLARSGQPRPRKQTLLGSVLGNYTNKANKNYDPIFDRQIRALAPQWFKDPQTATANKQLLLQMAREGKPRPTARTPLGAALATYTSTKSGCYDPTFDRQIRMSAPQWFRDEIAHKKTLLLEMAREGKPRPLWVMPIGRSLHRFTRKATKSYDPVFDRQIRVLAPQWFEDLTTRNKRLLLQMAREGKPRPASDAVLGRALVHYLTLTHTAYDVAFKRQIYKLAPQWFRPARKK